MPLRLSLWLAFLLGIGCSAPPAPPPPNESPVAEAGLDQTVQLQERVTVDGSRSTDPEGDQLEFSWSSSLDNPTSLIFTETQPSFNFVPTVTGTYVFILIVSDGESTSRPDSVRITVLGDHNQPPIADAGPDLIVSADSIIPLSAINSSDPDGDILTYLWQLLQSPGPLTIADSAAAQTTVTLSSSGNYHFRLTVSDGISQHTDEVIIIVNSSANLVPNADAGPDQQVAVGVLVTLDGSASADPEEEALTYRWTVGRTPGTAILLSDSTAVQPTFIPSESGEYVFALVVSDGTNSSLQAVVTILVLDEVFNEQGGMIEIPAGPFGMGSELGANDERPVHRVELSSFWIDKFEITVESYNACIAAGVCDPAGLAAGCNGGRTDRLDHPINCITWEQAQAYCGWATKRLPTEAEWEKAARGPDGRRFVWGDEFPGPERLNYNDNVGTTVPGGTYPSGLSFYGLHNMGGNVHEWTADFYASDYYAQSPEQDPTGPAEGSLRVVRGASWRVGVPMEALTATVRQAFQPATTVNSLGFRCARTQPPTE
jgi:formylglycine-generating enzyme required for sulfatase activity